MILLTVGLTGEGGLLIEMKRNRDAAAYFDHRG